MIIWIDAQLPPSLALWLSQTFGVTTHAVRDLGLRDATDKQIFDAARCTGAVLISKDSDFVDLVQRLGTPPQLLWVTCGNMTNRRLQELFQRIFPQACAMLRAGAPVIEIADAGHQ